MARGTLVLCAGTLLGLTGGSLSVKISCDSTTDLVRFYARYRKRYRTGPESKGEKSLRASIQSPNRQFRSHERASSIQSEPKKTASTSRTSVAALLVICFS